MNKTNVMRILDKKNIKYEEYIYDGEFTNGTNMAFKLNENPKEVFKTLVTTSGKNYYVFCIPVEKELDLKKCASAVREKSIEMVHSKDLLMVAGYVHGACSPIGLKKNYLVTFDSSINNIDNIYISGGKVCYQVKLKKDDLIKVINYQIKDITR